jgi:hypothetical protein
VIQATPRHKLASAGTAAVAAASLAFTACGSSSHQSTTAARASERVTTTSKRVPRQLRVTSMIPVPIDGPPLVAGFGAVWSASSRGLVRLTVPAARAEIVLRSPIDDVALSGCCVYALSRSSNSLIGFDPSHAKTTRRWRLPAGAASIVASGHDLYVALNGPPVAVERIDLESGAVRRATIPQATVLAQDRAIAAAPGRVWVIDGTNLYRLNPVTLSPVNTRTLGASDIWFGDGSLWAASENPNGGVERIDATTGRILASDTADAIQIAFTPHTVWLSAASGPTAIDPVTAHRQAALPTRRVPTQGDGGIAVVGRQVWTTYTDIDKLQKIQPGS